MSCNAPGADGVNNSWSLAVGALTATHDRRRRSASYALGGNCASPDGLPGGSNPPRTRHDSLGHVRELRLHGARRHAHHAGRALAVRGRLARAPTTRTRPTTSPARFEVERAQFGGDASSARALPPGAGSARSAARSAATRLRDASQRRRTRVDSFRSGSSAAATAGPRRVPHERRQRAPVATFIDLQGAAVTLEDTTAPRSTVGGAAPSRRLAAGQSDTVTYDASDNAGIRPLGSTSAAASRRDDGRVRLHPPVAVRSRRAATLSCRTASPTAPTPLRLVAEDAAGQRAGRRSARSDRWHAADRHPQARARQEDRALCERPGLGRGFHERRGPATTRPSRTGRCTSTFANGTLRATLDTGVASKIDIRVTVARQRRQRRRRAIRRGSPRPARRSAVASTGSARGRVRIPFGRTATLRGRLTLSAGEIAGRPDGRRDLDGPEEGRQDGGGRKRDHRPARPLLDQRPGRPEPHVPPRVRRLRRRARHRARLSVRVPASSTIQRIAHAALAPAASASPAACAAAASASRAAVSCVVLQGREGGKWRTFEDARTNKQGPLAHLLPLQRTTGELSDPPAHPQPGRLPVRARLLAQADDPGGLGGELCADEAYRSRWLSRAAIVSALLVLLIAQPASAARGTYDVYACTLPNGTPAPTEGWTAPSFGDEARSAVEQLLSPPTHGAGALRGELSAATRCRASTWLDLHRAERHDDQQLHAVAHRSRAGSGGWTTTSGLATGLASFLLRRAVTRRVLRRAASRAPSRGVGRQRPLRPCEPAIGFRSPGAAARSAARVRLRMARAVRPSVGDHGLARDLRGADRALGLRSARVHASAERLACSTTTPLAGRAGRIAFVASDPGGGIEKVGIVVDGVAA